MDIYRICSLGKTLTETINEVIKDPTEELVNKIWKLYDQSLEEEMGKLKEYDAMISVTRSSDRKRREGWVVVGREGKRRERMEGVRKDCPRVCLSPHASECLK